MCNQKSRHNTKSMLPVLLNSNQDDTDIASRRRLAILLLSLLDPELDVLAVDPDVAGHLNKPVMAPATTKLPHTTRNRSTKSPGPPPMYSSRMVARIARVLRSRRRASSAVCVRKWPRALKWPSGLRSMNAVGSSGSNPWAARCEVPALEDANPPAPADPAPAPAPAFPPG